MELASQVIVITGGSKGLGQALAIALKARGAQIVICSRNEEEVNAAAQEMGVIGITADVTDESQLASVAEQTITQFGRIDIWINNAGVWMPKQPIEEISLEKAKRLFDVNVFGTINGMRAAARHMKPRGSGVIINVSSTTAFDGMGGISGTMYTSSKYAIRGLTNSARDEFKAVGVTLIGVYPGGFKSDIFHGEIDAELVKTFMSAEEVAAKIIANLESANPQVQLVLPRPGQKMSHELTRAEN